jgi:hypothetical protein
MRRGRRGMVSDEAVEHALALIDRSGVARWVEDELWLRQRGPGRPRALRVGALLCARLLLASDDRPPHLSAATELLFCRLSQRARATLGIEGQASDQRSFLARYRQVRYLFSAISSVLDPSGLLKNRRIKEDEFAQRCTEVSTEDAQLARERLERFMGDLLCASVKECGGVPTGALAYGLDATPVPLFSRGPSRRSGLCASDPDGGWYVRDGDHREREDHQGRPRSRVAWALAFGTRFDLPVRAMGFDLVVDYRIDQLGRQANSHGAVMVEGTWYCPSMPEVLVNATIDLRAGSIDGATHQARIAARADYALRRKSGPDADGYERFMCPAGGDRPKVRCALRTSSLWALGKRSVPAPPFEPPALCRQSAITIAPDVGARYAQSLAFGSEQRARHYATLRNTIEGWNGFAKDPAHEALAQPARRRVRGIAAQGILVTFLYVAANLRKIETHESQVVNRDAVQARKRARRRRTSLKDYTPG